MISRKPLLLTAVAVLTFLFAVGATRGVWLGALGSALVRDEPPEKSDAILVLAGDFRGDRIMKACELVRQGYAPVVLVSGPTDWYGVNEATLAIRFAAQKGCQESLFEPLYSSAMSTQEEAEKLGPVMERRGIRNLIVVTSNYHTARSGRIFDDRLNGRMQIRTVAAPDPYFRPSNWWQNREGRKTFFFEATKTIAVAIGL